MYAVYCATPLVDVLAGILLFWCFAGLVAWIAARESSLSGPQARTVAKYAACAPRPGAPFASILGHLYMRFE